MKKKTNIIVIPIHYSFLLESKNKGQLLFNHFEWVSGRQWEGKILTAMFILKDA